MPQIAFAQYDAKCFRLDNTANIKQVIVKKTIAEDTEIPFGFRASVSGLSVSGKIVFEDEEESYVRVVLKDDYNYEHLVYENYPLLADGMSVEFENVAIETKQLNRITPKSIRVEIKNTTFSLESFSYVVSSGITLENETVLQKVQNQHVVDVLNGNLAKHNKLWRAGMTSMAEKTYEEKKTVFGGKLPQLFGFEYYAGGFFVMPGCLKNSEQTKTRNITSSLLVPEWDWRDRHGKCWVTEVKNQHSCGACWAFSAIATVEAYVNLYYNRLINYDLSEQEMVSCISPDIGCGGGTAYEAFAYITDNGVVKETCFPYYNSKVSCGTRCKYPDERVYTYNYGALASDTGTFHNMSDQQVDTLIKKKLFISPISIGILPWHHIINLIGYKTVSYGDHIYLGDSTNQDSIIVDDSHASLIGKTAWLVKNSWGSSWGSNGYGYIIADKNSLNLPHYISGRIDCRNFDDNDIICEDADGDGYYFWGLGPKPANCPSGVHDTPDGDDSNSLLGPMDQFGYLTDLSNLSSQTVILSNTTYSTNMTMSNNTVVIADAILTITGTVTMGSGVKLTVHYNGTIIVDGGTLQNADLALNSGCHVIVKNGGNIIMRSGKQFEAPLGSTVDILNGEIQ